VGLTGVAILCKKSSSAKQTKKLAQRVYLPDACPRVDVSTAQKHVFVGKPKRQFRLREINDLPGGQEAGLWASVKVFVPRFK
jgi:hypothetical protein